MAYSNSKSNSNEPTSLEAMGFEDLSSMVVVPRLVIASSAHEKSGKTHFLGTMPGDLAVISNDTGTKKTLAKFSQSKKIHLKYHKIARKEDGASKSDWEKQWQAWTDDYYRVIDPPLSLRQAMKRVRSLGIDTGTQAWELCRLARFGKLTQVMPHHYGPVNDEFRNLVQSAYDARDDLNILWIHKVKKEYKATKKSEEGQWTGKFERAGFGDIAYLVDMNIEHFFRVRDLPEEEGGGEVKEFGVRVLQSRDNMLELVGEEFVNDDCNFPWLAWRAYPDTTELEEWQ